MFTKSRALTAVLPVLLFLSACETDPGEQLLNTIAGLPAPDAVDTRNANVERSTELLDLTDIRTIRIELPTARVSLKQSGDGSSGSLQVTKIITRKGLSHDTVAKMLNGTEVTAKRAFVDSARLDVQATLAPDLAYTDIVFDIRMVVPVGAHAEVILGGGPVEISEMTGNVEVRTANGAISLSGITGNVIAETTRREVKVSDINGNVRAVTTDADVSLRLAPGSDGVISAETTSGDILITLDKSTAARLDLLSIEGFVTADLGGFNVADLAFGAGFLKGTLNGGGGSIEAKSASGEISFIGM